MQFNPLLIQSGPGDHPLSQREILIRLRVAADELLENLLAVAPCASNGERAAAVQEAIAETRQLRYALLIAFEGQNEHH